MNDLDESRRQVLETVAAILREIVGEEWIRDAAITMATSFNDDLELESIEIVSLSERLQERYGESVDFAAWLSEKELDEIINLKVGELVEYVASCQA